MSFLQPWMLFALPLAALPIIIHLINQRRYQTTQWAAMMFLLAANRMNRGYARIRQWAILALRTLVILALVFAVGRPLSSGLLSSTINGGASANTIVLLDRSPSMQQRDASGGLSKLESGVRNLTQTLGTTGATRVILIESNRAEAIEVESPSKLLDLPDVGPSDASADVPAMMLAALDYIRAGELGQTEVWVCSDLRDSDWHSKDGRWTSVREAFAEFGRRVRFHLLAFPEVAASNRCVRATEVTLSPSESEPTVAITIRITGDETSAPQTIPVTIEIEGARSIADVPFDGTSGELKGHRIAVPRGQSRGWGRLSIPADALLADNDHYFTFDIAPPRRTIVVTDNKDIGRVLKLAAEISPSADVPCEAEVISPETIAAVDWQTVSLALWQSEVTDSDKGVLESFVGRGGSLIFLPGDRGQTPLPFGLHFGEWAQPDDAVAVVSWRGDADLLSATLAGASLPVGSLRVERYVRIEGESTPLATLAGGSPLIVRAQAPRGGAYAIATTPDPTDSSLAADGVVLYVMIQRAIEDGARALRVTGQLDAGEVENAVAANWQPLVTRDGRLSTDRASTAGVYADDNRWSAINRSIAEDQTTTLGDDQVDELFRGLLFDRVDQTAGATSSIVEEVWRAFLLIMLFAMVGEAILCLPRRVVDAKTPFAKGAAA